MYSYKMDHIFSFNATLKLPPEVIGVVPEGLRLTFYVTGGIVEGPEVNGKVLPVGADWMTVRRDGVGIINVRATLETNDGALIYVTYPGVSDFGENGFELALRQELPPVSPIRTSPSCCTAHPKYLWLNRLSCVGIGQSDMANSQVKYDVYAVR
jgi:hypothetical protein